MIEREREREARQARIDHFKLVRSTDSSEPTYGLTDVDDDDDNVKNEGQCINVQNCGLVASTLTEKPRNLGLPCILSKFDFEQLTLT
jgi:hypothetical protein